MGAHHPPAAETADGTEETTGKSLVDILREAGVEAASEGRHRPEDATQRIVLPPLPQAPGHDRPRPEAVGPAEPPAAPAGQSLWLPGAATDVEQETGVVASKAWEGLKAGIRRLVRPEPRLDDGVDPGLLREQARQAVLERFADQLGDPAALAPHPHTEESDSDGRWVLHFLAATGDDYTVVLAPVRDGRRWVRGVRSVARQSPQALRPWDPPMESARR